MGNSRIPLREGYPLQCLEEACVFRNINCVLRRGNYHPDPLPNVEIPGHEEVVSAPNLCKDLNIVAVEPYGNHVSTSEMWVVHQDRAAFVEPVATGSNYRWSGPGLAVVLGSLRRAFLDGVDAAWVGSGIPSQAAVGFKPMYAGCPLVK